MLLSVHTLTGREQMKALGERIKYRREMLGLTQRELAAKVGLTHGAIALYELGKREPDLQTLQRIAAALNTTMSYLLGETDDPEPIRVREEAAHDSRLYDAHLPLDPQDILDLERAVRRANEILQRMKQRQRSESPEER